MKLEKKIISAEEHGLSMDAISPEALNIITTLQAENHQAYIVGGAVRDLLIGKKPTDFDIVTSALPTEVKRLFKRCVLIGKRFVLAHVYIGNNPIEVSTFRATPTALDASATDQHKIDEEGRILKGNYYTDRIEDDVLNRDYTLNALYLNPTDATIVDLIGGYQDCKQRRVNFINPDPAASIKEDPARILRYIRFSELLASTPPPEIEACIQENKDRIDTIPSARRIVELIKMFHSGYGYASYCKLEQYDLIKLLFGAALPQAEEGDEEHPLRKFVRLGLENTDSRILKQNHTNRAFLMAVLYWPYAMVEFNHALPSSDKIFSFTKTLFGGQLGGLQHVYQNMLLKIWTTQTKFRELSPEKIPEFCRLRYFRATYDFYLLRVQSGLESEERLELWTQSRDQYSPATQSFKGSTGRRQFPRRRRRFGDNQKKSRGRMGSHRSGGGNRLSPDGGNAFDSDDAIGNSVVNGNSAGNGNGSGNSDSKSNRSRSNRSSGNRGNRGRSNRGRSKGNSNSGNQTAGNQIAGNQIAGNETAGNRISAEQAYQRYQESAGIGDDNDRPVVTTNKFNLLDSN